MNFASDNVYGVHPQVLAALVQANERLTDVSYGHDEGAAAAEQALARLFGKAELRAFLVLNGSMANALCLAAMVPPYGAVLCHEGAHINTDECNAPELHTGGAKLVPLPGGSGKLQPATLERALARFVHEEHGALPAAVSITQATELGTVYTPAEVAALAAVCRAHGLRLHMDGARFANALAHLGCSAAELTWQAGVDALSFGGTKNGGLIIEACVFFDPALAERFLWRRKRAGQLLSKGRYLSAQLLAYLQDGLWLASASRANALAQRLAEGLARVPGVRLAEPTQANEVFVVMPRPLFAALQAAGALFYEWPTEGLPAGEVQARLVTAWATPEAEVQRFVSLAQQAGAAAPR